MSDELKRVGVEELTGAMTDWSESLKRQIKENKRVLGDVEGWRAEADGMKEIALECFDVQGEMTEEISSDPETGCPSLWIRCNVSNSDHRAVRDYREYARRIAGRKYSHLIVMDVSVVKDEV